MSAVYEHTLTLKSPWPSPRVIVEFTPVRGSIHGVRQSSPLQPVASLIGPLTLLAALPVGAQPDGEFSVTLMVTGEPVNQHQVHAAPTPSANPQVKAAAGPRDWPLIYRAREVMSDPKQAFFFELERTTNPCFFDYAGISDHEKKARTMLLSDTNPNSIICQLTERVKHRFEGHPPAQLRSRTETATVSALFREAAAKLRQANSWDVVGEALLEFAAGRLMKNIIIQTTDHENRRIEKNIIVTAPDSFYIFFYAEFAMAAIELDVDAEMWAQLLPYLCQMQSIYVERFERRPYSLREYHGIPRESPSHVATLQPHKTDARWEDVMRENLRAAAQAF